MLCAEAGTAETGETFETTGADVAEDTEADETGEAFETTGVEVAEDAGAEDAG